MVWYDPCQNMAEKFYCKMDVLGPMIALNYCNINTLPEVLLKLTPQWHTLCCILEIAWYIIHEAFLWEKCNVSRFDKLSCNIALVLATGFGELRITHRHNFGEMLIVIKV